MATIEDAIQIAAPDDYERVKAGQSDAILNMDFHSQAQDNQNQPHDLICDELSHLAFYSYFYRGNLTTSFASFGSQIIIAMTFHAKLPVKMVAPLRQANRVRVNSEFASPGVNCSYGIQEISIK